MASAPASTRSSTARYTVHVSVTRNGDRQPSIEVVTNGTARQWTMPQASNHVVYYLAVLSCIVDAIALGATSAVVEIGDQTAARQLNGHEIPQQKHTRALYEAIWIAAGALSGKLIVV